MSDSADCFVIAERQSHSQYLREFRTQQCRDFQSHKCQKHRPFNCFSYHFSNQRRRAHVLGLDRTSSGHWLYDPDVYCPKYDEANGTCPNGDECPFVHKNSGDTERRYHPRYYKTVLCTYESDSNGHCLKNGAHCPYAHGLSDLRNPLLSLLAHLQQREQLAKAPGVHPSHPSSQSTANATSNIAPTSGQCLNCTPSANANANATADARRRASVPERTSQSPSHPCISQTQGAPVPLVNCVCQQNSAINASPPGLGSKSASISVHCTCGARNALAEQMQRHMFAMNNGNNGNGVGLCASGCPLPPQVDDWLKTQKDEIKWLNIEFVLANYKTEQCRKQARVCRQGYACPYFHSNKDRRRAPTIFKYRSTPCPLVRQGDEWSDPSACEAGDTCQYCHTRTEQQFHPEIFKSSKCNDMIATGYCPRGPYCAFAHLPEEVASGRTILERCIKSLTANNTVTARPKSNCISMPTASSAPSVPANSTQVGSRTTSESICSTSPCSPIALFAPNGDFNANNLPVSAAKPQVQALAQVQAQCLGLQHSTNPSNPIPNSYWTQASSITQLDNSPLSLGFSSFGSGSGSRGDESSNQDPSNPASRLDPFKLGDFSSSGSLVLGGRSLSGSGPSGSGPFAICMPGSGGETPPGQAHGFASVGVIGSGARSRYKSGPAQLALSAPQTSVTFGGPTESNSQFRMGCIDVFGSSNQVNHSFGVPSYENDPFKPLQPNQSSDYYGGGALTPTNVAQFSPTSLQRSISHPANHSAHVQYMLYEKHASDLGPRGFPQVPELPEPQALGNASGPGMHSQGTSTQFPIELALGNTASDGGRFALGSAGRLDSGLGGGYASMNSKAGTGQAQQQQQQQVTPRGYPSGNYAPIRENEQRSSERHSSTSTSNSNMISSNSAHLSHASVDTIQSVIVHALGSDSDAESDAGRHSEKKLREKNRPRSCLSNAYLDMGSFHRAIDVEEQSDISRLLGLAPSSSQFPPTFEAHAPQGNPASGYQSQSQNPASNPIAASSRTRFFSANDQGAIGSYTDPQSNDSYGASSYSLSRSFNFGMSGPFASAGSQARAQDQLCNGSLPLQEHSLNTDQVSRNRFNQSQMHAHPNMGMSPECVAPPHMGASHFQQGTQTSGAPLNTNGSPHQMQNMDQIRQMLASICASARDSKGGQAASAEDTIRALVNEMARFGAANPNPNPSAYMGGQQGHQSTQHVYASGNGPGSQMYSTSNGNGNGSGHYPQLPSNGTGTSPSSYQVGGPASAHANSVNGLFSLNTEHSYANSFGSSPLPAGNPSPSPLQYSSQSPSPFMPVNKPQAFDYPPYPLSQNPNMNNSQFSPTTNSRIHFQ